MKLVDCLLDLCNYPVGAKETSLSLHRQFPVLYRLAPTILVIPLQVALNVSLPADASQMTTHKPFPDKLVVFQSKSHLIASSPLRSS
jgi:serine/threonine-protein kinase ATR